VTILAILLIIVVRLHVVMAVFVRVMKRALLVNVLMDGWELLVIHRGQITASRTLVSMVVFVIMNAMDLFVSVINHGLEQHVLSSSMLVPVSPPHV